GATSPLRITFAGRIHYPIWTPDGQRIAFESTREGDRGIFWQRADGSGTAERLTKPAAGNRHIPQAWSPKGDVLLFSERGERTTLQTLTLADKKIAQFGGVEEQAIGPFTASFSRDGRWVAYSVFDNVGPRVYIQPFPATGAKYQIAADRSADPVWSR